MSSHAVSLPSILIPSIKDSEIYDLIKMLIRENLPVSVVEDDKYRIVFKHTQKIFKETDQENPVLFGDDG